jgi:hypothetical protein
MTNVNMGANKMLIIAGGVRNLKEASEINDIIKISKLAKRIKELSKN